MLSLNIQSLSSKYEHLKIFIQNLTASHVPVDVILLQETWEIRYPLLFNIPGFQNIIYRTRAGMRGGGVGVYVRNGLSFKERTDLENYKLKTFENIVLEILYPNTSMIISNIYRSPNPPPNITVAEHLDIFLDTLDTHLARISNLDKKSYVFTDSNIIF